MTLVALGCNLKLTFNKESKYWRTISIFAKERHLLLLNSHIFFSFISAFNKLNFTLRYSVIRIWNTFKILLSLSSVGILLKSYRVLIFGCITFKILQSLDSCLEYFKILVLIFGWNTFKILQSGFLVGLLLKSYKFLVMAH